MLSTLLLLVAAGAADPPAFETELERHLDEALRAFEQRHYLSFEQIRSQIERDLEQLPDVLRGEPLVALHLVGTARAWLDGDEAGLRAGFRGLRAVSPGFQLPEGWSEGDERVERLYREAVAAGPGREARLPTHLVVDGRMASDRLPLERATVVQVRNPRGSWTTWYVEPGGPSAALLAAQAAAGGLPEEPAAPVPVPAVSP